jgi:hypothetical protein
MNSEKRNEIDADYANSRAIKTHSRRLVDQRFMSSAQAPSKPLNLMNTGMSSEVKSEFDVKYEDLIQRIREAAAAAIRQLNQLRSVGPMSRETLDAEVGRIAQEKLHRYGCDLVVHRRDDGITRFLIKVQSTGRKYDLIKSFFHRDDGSKAGHLTYGPGS